MLGRRKYRFEVQHPKPRWVKIMAGVVAIIAATLVLTLGPWQATPSKPHEPEPMPAPTAPQVPKSEPHKPGDDNGDGVIDEDESGFNCKTMGNKQCGPGAPADGYVNK